jgi:dihydrofolate reductase
MSLIACYDLKFGIGKKNEIPWDIKEDLSYFKEFTFGKTLIAGSKTFESLPRSVFKNRTVIPVGRQYNSFNDAVAGVKDPVFIGGKEIYREALVKGLVKTMHLSQVDEHHNCDVDIDFILPVMKSSDLVGLKVLTDNCVVRIFEVKD